MRAFCAAGAALLIACAVPATGRADAASTRIGHAPQVSTCDEPGPGFRKKRVVRKVVRRHVRRHYRHHPPLVAATPLPVVYYNPALPSPYDTAYDRGMLLHFTSPPVSGLYQPEPPMPPTPPIAGVHYYRVQPGPVVLQYDGLIGQYVQLARDDPAQIAVAMPPPPPPPPH